MRPYPSLGQALFLLGAGLGLQVGAAAALLAIFPAVPPLLRGALANLVALSTVALWGYSRSGEPPVWGPRPGVSRGFVAGMVLAALGGTVVLGELANACTLILPLPASLAQLFDQLTQGSWPLSLLTLSVVAPLTEEALFRGLLLRGFAQRWGEFPALLLSSALFALFHLNVWQAPAAFVGGLFLGWLYLRTRSLLYPMVTHGLFNGFPVVLQALGVVVTGYNSPPVVGVAEFQPLGWLAAGALVLGLGLALARRSAPLSPPPVSDRVAP